MVLRQRIIAGCAYSFSNANIKLAIRFCANAQDMLLVLSLIGRNRSEFNWLCLRKNLLGHISRAFPLFLFILFRSRIVVMATPPAGGIPLLIKVVGLDVVT